METVFGLCFELNCRFFICDYSFKKGRERAQKLSSLTDHVDALASLIHEKRAEGGRLIVAIAGAPGSGKSTLAKEVARRISLQKCPCIVVPMDGFHLDNAILEDLNLIARKGAPETFD
ncbi:MAG: NB-ARC domain-containing protein, partial [Loktanella sp.]|nr:NB-ARC domain-containing protein [Loktanella sp.]